MLWIVLSSLFFASALSVPKTNVQISTCDAPVADQTLSVCCFAQNLPEETSIFVSNNSVHVARISQSCDLWYPSIHNDTSFNFSCSTKAGNVTVYNITYFGTTHSSNDANYAWECGFYGQKASMKIIALKTHNFIRQSQGSSVALRYTLTNLKPDSGTVRLYRMDSNITVLEVYTKNNSVIHTNGGDRILYTGNVTNGEFSAEIRNLTQLDNGTYVIQYFTKNLLAVRFGITVVVLGKPQASVINNTRLWKTSGNVVSGYVTCDAVSGSAAPLFYVPEQEFYWYYPSKDSWPPGVKGYNVTTNGSVASISDVECDRLSMPVYCAADEHGFRSDISLGFYPHDMCSAKTSDDSHESVSANTGALIAVIFFVTSTVYVTVISAVIARRFLRKKMRCFGKCCTCCSCCSGSDSDSDLDRIIRRSLHDIEEPVWNRRPAADRGLVSLADGLRRQNTNNDEVQRALERIAIEESREIFQRQQNFSGLDNPVFRRAVANERVADENVAVNVDGIRLDVPPVELQGAEGGEVRLRGAEGGARSSVSDDIVVLKEVETLIQQHHDHLLEDVVHLDISRASIVDNLIALYTEEALALCRVTVKMVDEEGMDCGGITLDMYTTFWARAQEQFFTGCERVVPELQAHRFSEESKFRVLGRILSHSIAIMKAFPIPMCKSTIIAMIYDTTEVAAETLLEDFLYFLDDHERTLVTTAVNNYSSLTEEQVEELSSVFERFNYGARPSMDTFKHHVTQLARHVTCIRPRPLLELMRSGIPPTHLEHFWSRFHLRNLDVLFLALKPTPERVITRLKVIEDQRQMSRQQSRVLKYLKDLLQEMSEPELHTFLQFVTGKKSMPRDQITIQFTTDSGSLRTPKAHTCSSLLELPETYENYETFRSEFKHLMASDEALSMTMA